MNDIFFASLRKVVPAANMYRQYSVAAGKDLFGTPVVTCRWGRIGKRGQMRQFMCATLEEAKALAEKFVEKRRCRGYQEAQGAEDTPATPPHQTKSSRAQSTTIPGARPQAKTQKSAVEDPQLWLLDWTATSPVEITNPQPATRVAHGGLAAALEMRPLMRNLGKPATLAERERAISLLKLAASLRGLPLRRGAIC